MTRRGNTLLHLQDAPYAPLAATRARAQARGDPGEQLDDACHPL
jgi:hypothetical protein